MTVGRRRTPVAVGMVLAVLAAAPAVAHEGDPQVRTELRAVEPDLPEGVVVQVQANIAPQVVVANPTSVDLDVLGDDGQPFLRISSRGVQANLESVDFYTTSIFSGSTAAVPRAVLERRTPVPPRWTLLSRGSSWGWFDHRLDAEDAVPADRSRPAVLGEWEVPLRYGGREVVARGRSLFEPVLGALQVTIDPPPPGLTAQVLQGRRPGLFVSHTDGPPVTVLDGTGQPYVRLSADGVQLNTSSPLHVADTTVRTGAAAELPSPEPSFTALPGRSRTWLDDRLLYGPGVPPDDVLRRSEPSELGRWQVPLLVGDRPASLTGTIRWVPSAAAEQVVRQETVGASERSAVLPIALGAGAALVLTCAVLAVRRRRRA